MKIILSKTEKILTSLYGMRNGVMHWGDDFNFNYEPILAPRDGWVRIKQIGDGVKPYPGKPLGRWVAFEHTDGSGSRYFHLREKDFCPHEVGTFVKQGQVLCYSGDTGYSTGAHLHFEWMTKYGNLNTRVNTIPYITYDNNDMYIPFISYPEFYVKFRSDRPDLKNYTDEQLFEHYILAAKLELVARAWPNANSYNNMTTSNDDRPYHRILMDQYVAGWFGTGNIFSKPISTNTPPPSSNYKPYVAPQLFVKA